MRSSAPILIRAGTIASIVACVLTVSLMLVYYGIRPDRRCRPDRERRLHPRHHEPARQHADLPGIAGIVLTIGTAVDLNVLIYERIREEARNGRPRCPPSRPASTRPCGTIIDANVTHLIAALALFQFGTGPVKGFAVTLAFGILANMFTSVTLTRPRSITGTGGRGRPPSRSEVDLHASHPAHPRRHAPPVLPLPLDRLHLVGGRAGGGGGWCPRSLNYGIDFKGGILLEVKTPGPADLARMRGVLDELGMGEVSLQEAGGPTRS